MFLSAVVFFTTGAILCCLPACSSIVECTIAPDKSVYAFPSNIWTDRNRNIFYFLSFKVNLRLDQNALDAAGSRNRSEATLNLPETEIELQDCATEGSSEPDNFQQTVNLTVDARCFFERSKVERTGEAAFWFQPVFESYNDKVFWCGTIVSWAQDNAPSVLFETALNVSPRKLKTNTSIYLNKTSANVVELKINNIDNEIEVHLQVKDNDFFEENDDQLEFCDVSKPSITLSAVVTFHNFSKKSNSSTPYNLPLATDDGLNQNEGAWWKKNSSRVNKTLINVRLDFVVSALCAAINGLLSSSGHLSLDSYSVAYVNITLNVTATSGTTNPQQSNGKLTLVLVFNGECTLVVATAQSYTVTTEQNLITIKTAQSDTVTTANEETGTERNLFHVLTAQGDTVTTANDETGTEMDLFLVTTAHSNTVTTSNEQDLFLVTTAHSNTVTTANDETGTTKLILLVVVIGATLSVIVMSVLIASLAVKYRAHLLRLKTSSARPLVDDSIFRFNLKNTQIYSGPSSLPADQYR